ncbi:MAG TPA: phosphatase domain-containing protein [Xanthomonadaceae bacterium]|nr:phosphatase domain-containing protein [Xanthomonadaceae bacterium]
MDPAKDTRWPAALRRYAHAGAVDLEEQVDAAWRRFDTRFGRSLPRHIAAYRGHGDARGIELLGRVLAETPQGGPQDDDDWWDNLLATYRRFESDEVPGVEVQLRFGTAKAAVTTGPEGYYTATIEPAAPLRDDCLWENAIASLGDGTLATPQPVLQVPPDARIGVISDIDDTILQSSITDWKTAAQLTFLHNARTRKPLQGVSKLYQALQAGPGGGARKAPIFYVSSSPWNLYDLLEDFMDLNAIPCGPIFLRDLGLDEKKFIKSAGHGHKLERAAGLIERYPHMRWVLLGDSGQADAELYAEAARTFGDRIAAIYIRDVDPLLDSPLDKSVDGHIERVAGTPVPMLRARDSLAMAEHAAGLGLLDPARLADIAAEVERDAERPGLGEAATEEAVESAVEDTGKGVRQAARAVQRAAK